MNKQHTEGGIEIAMQAGYTDFSERGTYARWELECVCIDCSKAYLDGQKKAVKDMMNKFGISTQ